MKDIYELLNNINIDENEFEEAEVNEIEKNNLKKNLKEALKNNKAVKKKKLFNKKSVSVVAAITLLCILSTIIVKPTLATSIPIIGELVKKELISNNQQFTNYIDAIGKTKSYEGIDVTFESAIADDNKLFLSFVVKNNNEEINNDNVSEVFLFTSIKVNGKSINASGSGTWDFVNKNTVRVLKVIDWSKYKLGKEMNIDINISKLYGKSGDWGTNFFIDKSKQVEKTVEKNINAKLNIEGKTAKVLSVTASPLTIDIKWNSEFDTIGDNGYLDFILIDDEDNELAWYGRAINKEGFDKFYNCNSSFISNNNMKSIKIIPVYTTKSSIDMDKLPAVKLDFNNVRPKELINSKDLSINIKDYFIEDGYLIVKYNQKYFGKEYSRQVFNVPIYVMFDGTEIKQVGDDDNKGIDLYKKYNNPNEKIGIYKIGASRDIMIGTYDGSNVKILKDKSFTVEMKK